MKNGQTAWPARFPHSIKFWSVLCDFFARFRVVEEFRVAFEVVNDLGDGPVSRDVRRRAEAILCQIESDDETLHRRIEPED